MKFLGTVLMVAAATACSTQVMNESKDLIVVNPSSATHYYKVVDDALQRALCPFGEACGTDLKKQDYEAFKFAILEKPATDLQNAKEMLKESKAARQLLEQSIKASENTKANYLSNLKSLTGEDSPLTPESVEEHDTKKLQLQEQIKAIQEQLAENNDPNTAQDLQEQLTKLQQENSKVDNILFYDGQIKEISKVLDETMLELAQLNTSLEEVSDAVTQAEKTISHIKAHLKKLEDSGVYVASLSLSDSSPDAEPDDFRDFVTRLEKTFSPSTREKTMALLGVTEGTETTVGFRFDFGCNGNPSTSSWTMHPNGTFSNTNNSGSWTITELGKIIFYYPGKTIYKGLPVGERLIGRISFVDIPEAGCWEIASN